MFNSLKNSLIQIFSFPVCTSECISDSVEEETIRVVCFVFHEINPPKQKKKYPYLLLDPNSPANAASQYAERNSVPLGLTKTRP
jgi:hypothetical protein